MPTYEITDKGSYTQVLLKEGADVISRYGLPKSVSIRVRNGVLEVFREGTASDLKIPRRFITIPSSTSDEDLFNNLSFMSESVGGGVSNRGYDDAITFTVSAGGGDLVFIGSVSMDIGSTYLLESEAIMEATASTSGYASKIKSASIARYYDNGAGGTAFSGSPNTLPDPSISTLAPTASAFLIASNGNIFYQVGVTAGLPECSCRLYYSITKL